MKVKITKDSKKILTIEEAPIAQKLVAELKEYDEEISDMANLVGRIVTNGNGYFRECLKATARVAKNCRIWDYYFDGSRDLDVWMEFYLYDCYYCFYDVGIYLSDVFRADGETETYEDICRHSFIVKYAKVEN